MAYTPIDKSSDYFNIKLYTGNATNPTTISEIGFQPDWVWTKLRAGGTEAHRLCDAVRGVTKDLFSDASDAQATNLIGLKSFNSDGYVIGNSNGYNINSGTFVSWNWKAGTAFTNDASATGIGTIDSTGSVNTDAGFSIITYTGTGANATVAHGLSAIPKMIILKSYSASANWIVYHNSIGNGKALSLNTTAAESADAGYFNSTTPTSTVFSLGNDGFSNGSSQTIVAYCFAEKQGYSKFGSYTGNGSTDGTFVYTGFKPAFTLIKRTDSATGGSWILFDNKRGTNVINPVDVVLAASNNQTEADWGTTFDCDYLSNGFKWRFNGTAGYNNASGATYIYMAFAENPFVTSTAIPACAR